MSKVKQFLANRVENFKQAGWFGKVWRIAGYGVLAFVLLGILLPSPSENEMQGFEDQVKVEQEQAVKEEAVKEQAAQEQAAKEEAAKEQAEKKEAARKAKVEASKTPEQKIEESLKDSLGDQYRAATITKKPGGYHVFVKFDTDDAAHKLTIMQDARMSYESIDQPVVDFAFNAYTPTMDGEEALSMKAEKAAEFDQVIEQEDAWDITFIHPDLR